MIQKRRNKEGLFWGKLNLDHEKFMVSLQEVKSKEIFYMSYGMFRFKQLPFK